MAPNRNCAALLTSMAIACFAVSGNASAEDNERGADLFRLCAVCHGEDASGQQAVGAPAIAGMPQWYLEAQLKQFRDGNRGTHFDDLMGMRMRPMARSLAREGDVEAVAAYVAALPPANPAPTLTGGDVEAGKATYTTICITCHGPEAAGNKDMMGAAPLARSSDWYMYRQVKNFKSGVRGSRPGDQGGALMRPMMLQLKDDQDIKNVVAYIMTLGN